MHSRGRFLLGLGNQIRPHIERRFAMPWSRPAARMREYICAELGDELHHLSVGRDADRWDRMGELVDDAVLAAFAVVAEPDALGPALVERWGGLADRFSFYTLYELDEAVLAPAVAALRAPNVMRSS